MNKRNLRLSAGSEAVKASLLVFFAALIMSIGCGKGIGLEHEIGDTNTAQCTSFYCSGNGGNTGTTNVGGAGGQGGSTTSVGGSGTGGHAGAASTGGAGGFGGNVTTGTGGSAGATNVGGAGGSGGATTTTSGTGGSGSAGTGGHAGAGGNTTTSTGTGGAGGATTTSTGTGGAGGSDAGPVCKVDEKMCNNVCVAKNDPAYGCNVFVCSACPALANATSACDAFQDCVVGACNIGFGNCDNNPSNGCETQIDSDPNNCGACGTVCGVNTLCQSGKCVQQPLNSFSCSGWTRDAAFDAFKIPDQNNQPADVKLVGGIWGTSGDDFYISAATYGKGVVAHWYSGAFHLEALPGDPPKVHGIWGSGPNDVWIAAETAMQGVLYHRVNGAWAADVNAPSSTGYQDVWGSDSDHVFLAGYGGVVGKVWKKSGSNWIDTNLPDPKQAGDISYVVSRVWGFDSMHVFVTGYRFNAQSEATGGVLWFYNGATWKIVQTPAEANGFSTIHGTSVQDFFVSGSGANALVYHVTNNLSTWIAFARPNFAGYGPLLSLKAGTFLAAGYQPPAGAGALRITTLDQVAPAAFYAVDNEAYNPVAFWKEPGTMKVHLVSISPPNGSLAGHYSGNCK